MARQRMAQETLYALSMLLGVSVIWGINYVVCAYLLHAFSPLLLSFIRISLTCVFLPLAVFKAQGMQKPTRSEWLLLLATGIFGTLIQQSFYFIGLHKSTAANASLIYAAAPLAAILLEAIFLKVKLSLMKAIGAVLGFAGVLVIVGFNGNASFGVSLGDLYLLAAMLGLTISLLFIPRLSQRLSSSTISFFSTMIGSAMLLPLVAREKLSGQWAVSGDWLPWALLIAAGGLTALAGVWWIRGVAVVGVGTASLFHNIPPFVALLAGHFILADPINMTQILGGLVVLTGVFVSNQKLGWSKRCHKLEINDIENHYQSSYNINMNGERNGLK